MKHLLKIINEQGSAKINFIVTKEDIDDFYLQKRDDIKTWLIAESEDST